MEKRWWIIAKKQSRGIRSILNPCSWQISWVYHNNLQQWNISLSCCNSITNLDIIKPCWNQSTLHILQLLPSPLLVVSMQLAANAHSFRYVIKINFWLTWFLSFAVCGVDFGNRCKKENFLGFTEYYTCPGPGDPISYKFCCGNKYAARCCERFMGIFDEKDVDHFIDKLVDHDWHPFCAVITNEDLAIW